MLILALLALSSAPAAADEAAYEACCSALATTCPAALEIVGWESRRTASEVEGLWGLTCEDGAAWYPHMKRVVAGPTPGLIVDAGDIAAEQCFLRSCALPADLCLEIAPSGTLRAVRCGTTELPREGLLASAPTARRTSATATREAWQAAAAEQAAATAGLPPAPPRPCVPDGRRRIASIEHLESGDAALSKGQLDVAAARYQDALTTNVCNGHAWAALGRLLLDRGELAGAAVALGHATGLAPTLTLAWLDLGRAHEALGRKLDAIDAYHAAMTVRPGYGPAEDGLRRAHRMP